MKTTSSYLAFFLLLFTWVSCTKKNDQQIEAEYLNSFLKQVKIAENIQWVVILPGLGCHGCIQEGEAFMKENIDNKNILFILNRIQSIKVLQNKTGVELKNKPNVYIDKETKLNILTDNKIYPCVIQLEDGKIKNHEFQSPKNSQAFNNLKSRIQSH